MQKTKKKTIVYIDGANLHFAAKALGINIDYGRLYIWLSDNFKTEDIYLFSGFIEKNKEIYDNLVRIGFKLIFKKTLKSKGKIKGNCDAELVLAASIDIVRNSIKEIVLVSSDGDFACLLEFAKSEGVGIYVVSPSSKLSFLIKTLNLRITYLKDIVTLIEYKSEKAPDVHQHSQGPSS